VIPGLFGLLTIISLALMLMLATVASLYVRKLRNRQSTQLSEEMGSSKVVLGKLRKREPMSQDELTYAKQIVADRSSPMALAIPGMIFMLGCFYVFGSLEHLHGARPSERTFLGVIPMLTSTNLALRMLSSRRLKRRLRTAVSA
jgi:Flp pilus assembly protein TadB